MRNAEFGIKFPLVSNLTNLEVAWLMEESLRFHRLFRALVWRFGSLFVLCYPAEAFRTFVQLNHRRRTPFTIFTPANPPP